MFYEVKLTIIGNRCFLSGTYPENIVKLVTSYKVKGYFFSKAYKNGHWNGRKELYSPATKSFPAGLVNTVVTALKKYVNNNIKVEIEDKRDESKPLIQNGGYRLLGIDFGAGRFDYQLEAFNAFLLHKRGIIKIATNGGKTGVSSAIIKHLGVKTLYVVPGLDLLSQARSDFAGYLGIAESKIGKIGEGSFDISPWITVASIDSLTSKFDDGELDRYKKYWDLIISDEVHTESSARLAAFDFLESYYRCATSATPLDRTDGANMDIVSQFGDVIYDLPNKVLVERGISVQPSVKIIKIDKPILPPNLSWKDAEKYGIEENDTLNDEVVKQTLENLEKNLQIVIMLEHINHGRTLLKKFQNSKFYNEIRFLNGKDDSSEERKDALNYFRRGELRCLIATSILNTGVNIPNIDVLIFAHAAKSKIRLIQRAGRGLRSSKNKRSLLIIDFVNFTNKHLIKHSLERIQIYKNEECFKITV